MATKIFITVGMEAAGSSPSHPLDVLATPSWPQTTERAAA